MKWPLVTIGSLKADVPNSLVGGPFGSDLTARDYTDSGVPVIRGANMNQSAWTTDADFVFVSEAKANALRANTAFRGDLVFTQRGTLGQVALIPPSAVFDRYVVSQSQMKLTVDAGRVDPRFVYYYFCSPSTVQTVKNHATTSGVPHINLGILRELTIPLPPLATQRKIVTTLEAYDNLIENNRRRMQLLEESARLLYQEWFVRLRFPGHEHVKIKDGVPEGWSREPLENVAEFRLGKMLDQRKNRGDLMPYLANVNVRWGSFDLHDLREMRFEHDEIEIYGLKFGDIVMCEGGEPGRCAIWREQQPRMMIQKAIHRIRCRPGMPHEYLYQSLRHQGHTGQLAAFFTGATIKHLPREKLAKVAVLVPPPELLKDFVDFAGPIQSQIGILETQTRRAAEARDILLPRLMSGELAV